MTAPSTRTVLSFSATATVVVVALHSAGRDRHTVAANAPSVGTDPARVSDDVALPPPPVVADLTPSPGRRWPSTLLLLLGAVAVFWMVADPRSLPLLDGQAAAFENAYRAPLGFRAILEFVLLPTVVIGLAADAARSGANACRRFESLRMSRRLALPGKRA
jgi:hypothetical protein